jgi:hypothetical protein
MVFSGNFLKFFWQQILTFVTHLRTPMFAGMLHRATCTNAVVRSLYLLSFLHSADKFLKSATSANPCATTVCGDYCNNS